MASYSATFYDGQVDESQASAAAVVPAVMALLHPASIIDIGCGVGGWLKAFQDAGVVDIAGQDGSWVQPANLLIDPAHFTARDLGADTPPPARRYDLAMTLEVAEHLHASKADTFVGYLCACADVVLFSAAVPGQGGTHHVNEQRLSYWVEKFAAQGFDHFDVLRPRLWDDRRIAWWYRQNITLFARRGSAPHPRLERELRQMAWPVDITHPEGFFHKADFKARFWDRPRFTLRRDLGAFGRRVRRSLGLS